MNKTVGFFFFIFFFSVRCLFAQEYGKPVIKNYTPKTYQAHVQNWSIGQDARGVLYFGNGDGILEYDGVSWKLLTIPTNTAVRAMFIDTDGRIYAGASDEFGYFSPKGSKLVYVSLAKKLNESDKKFADIWDINKADSAIFFRADNKLFKYKNNQLTVWTASRQFYKPFVYRNKYFIPDYDKGLLFLENNELVAAPFSGFFQTKILKSAIPVGDSVLISDINDGIIVYKPFHGKRNAPYLLKTVVNDNIKKYNYFTQILQQNDHFIVSTAGGGVQIIDKKGKLIQSLGQKQGLQNNRVHQIFLDAQNNLWMSLNNGISKAQINSPITFWDKEDGLAGTTECIIRHHGTLYIGTHQGIFYFEKNQLKKIEGSELTCWSFAEFQDPINKSNNFLLAAMSDGIFKLINNKLIKVLETETCYELYISEHTPSRVFMGLYDGFGSMIFQNGVFVFEGKYRGVPGNIRSVAEDKQGYMWLTSFRNGVIRMKMNQSISNSELVFYRENSGLRSLKNIIAFKMRDKIIFGTEKGLYFFNEKTNFFEPFKDLGNQFADGSRDVYNLIDAPNGQIWISGLMNKKSELGFLTNEKSDKPKWISSVFKTIPEMMILALYVEPNGIAWIGGSEGLYRFDSNQSYNNSLPFSALIRKVCIGRDSIIFDGANFNESGQSALQQIEDSIPDLPYHLNSVTFRFSSMSYINEEETRYRFFLQGNDKLWSDWQKTTSKDYTNLHEGKYTFRVEALNIFGVISSESSFSFVIKPPWYRTLWAYAVYFVFLFLLVFFIVFFFNKRLKDANIKLEKLVKIRTQEIQLQKEELQTTAEQMELTNKELAKLSLVASKTDNAVGIFDKNGNLEWVNDGFRRIYGFNYYEFVSSIGSNIYDTSSNSRIKEIINACVASKTSMNYESLNNTREGRKIWVQSTITPICDIHNQIEKFITIDSDITKIKEAELEILQRNEEIVAQKDELENKTRKIEYQNEQIKSSIRYGLTIQKAILPSKSVLDNVLNNFILYWPKDIVSGDFYWFHSRILKRGSLLYSNLINSFQFSEFEEYELFYLAVVDCTGHGVPGAFMSLIGNRMLNEIIVEKRIIKPSEILNQIDENVKDILRQNVTDNNDGMDVCLSLFIRKVGHKFFDTIIFSGSKRPLIIYNNQSGEINSIKGDSRSLGGFHLSYREVNFTDHKIPVFENDVVFMTTDGFVDQNDILRKRFGSTRLHAFIKKNAKLPLAEQCQLLEYEMRSHMANSEQRDDITIIAVKI